MALDERWGNTMALAPSSRDNIDKSHVFPNEVHEGLRKATNSTGAVRYGPEMCGWRCPTETNIENEFER